MLWTVPWLLEGGRAAASRVVASTGAKMNPTKGATALPQPFLQNAAVFNAMFTMFSQE
jgi:hypothetical protein